MARPAISTLPRGTILDRATSVTAFGVRLLSRARRVRLDGGWFHPRLRAGDWAGLCLRRSALDHVLAVTVGATLFASPLLRLAYGGPGWGAAIAAGQPIIFAGDLAVAMIGIGFAIAPAAVWRRPSQVDALVPAATG